MQDDVENSRLHPILTRIETHLPVRQSDCDLTWMDWRGDLLQAEFTISKHDDPCWFAVRVSLPRPLAVQLVDEFVDSVAGPRMEGLDASGFAYEVRDGVLAGYANEVVRLSYPNVREYGFISMNSCLYVLGETPPSFDLIEIAPVDAAEHHWPERRRRDADTDWLIRPADPNDPRVKLGPGP